MRRGRRRESRRRRHVDLLRIRAGERDAAAARATAHGARALAPRVHAPVALDGVRIAPEDVERQDRSPAPPGVLRVGNRGDRMTAKSNPVKERLSTLFAEELHVDVPDSGVDLLATARLDSLGVVELIMHIEKEFAIRVELEDLELENFRTIDSIAAFISARLESAGVPTPKR